MFTRSLCILGLAGVMVAARPPVTSVIITGARIVDGTGSAPRRVNVRIEKDRIAAVGDMKPGPSEEVVEGTGLVSETKELVERSKVAARHGGFYMSHIRDEADRAFEAFKLQEAVRKMTGAPAARLKLADRGRIAPGKIADLVLFDPATIADRSTFQEPFVLATGMKGVWVSGVRVWDGSQPTGAAPGQMLTR